MAKKIEKYSIATDCLETVGDMFDDREQFSACGFIDKILHIGGETPKGEYGYLPLATCAEFNTKDCTWKRIASMHGARTRAACAVFEEKAVVSGGRNREKLNTVEAYDPMADKWSCMPSMIESACDHSLVAVKNKLFAVGGFSKTMAEVYDSVCKMFVALKLPCLDYTYNVLRRAIKAISFGNRVIVFLFGSEEVLCYDTVLDEWSKESCCKSTYDTNFYYKVPKLKR